MFNSVPEKPTRPYKWKCESSDGKILSGLRENSCMKVHIRDETTLKNLIDYYEKLSTSDVYVRNKFRWYDAFEKPRWFECCNSNFAESTSLDFEKICVLWNIAALLLHLSANNMNSSDKDTLKFCVTRFKHAAGIFREIRSKTATMTELVRTNDLSTDTLVQLEKCSLAGAQTCLLVKTEKTEEETKEGQQKQFNIMAKLAAGVADIYRNVAEMDGQKRLAMNAQNMKSHFTSQSHFYQAAAYKAQSNHGHRIAHLKIAAKYSNSLPSEFDAFTTEINNELKIAEEDNSKIFFITVTKENDLPDIVSKILVEPVEFKAEELATLSKL